MEFKEESFQPRGGGGGWSFVNTHSVHNTSAASLTAGHVNFGQPTGWNFTPSTTEGTFNFWFRYDDVVGTLLSNRTNSVAGTHVALNGGGNLDCYWGSTYAGTSGLSLADGAWHFVTWTVRNEGGTYVGRVFVDGNTTSSANVSPAGSTPSTGIDMLMGQRRGSNNTDYPYGAYSNAWFAHLTYFSVGFTGTESSELYNSGTPMDPRLHSRAASLGNYLPLGSDDTSPTLTDRVGSAVGTMTFTATIAIEAVHP